VAQRGESVPRLLVRPNIQARGCGGCTDAVGSTHTPWMRKKRSSSTSSWLGMSSSSASGERRAARRMNGTRSRAPGLSRTFEHRVTRETRAEDEAPAPRSRCPHQRSPRELGCALSRRRRTRLELPTADGRSPSHHRLASLPNAKGDGYPHTCRETPLGASRGRFLEPRRAASPRHLASNCCPRRGRKKTCFAPCADCAGCAISAPVRGAFAVSSRRPARACHC
jgi:hypothetical protein